jgi:acetyltransferase-like isoleucine patch superfamily enzyme
VIEAGAVIGPYAVIGAETHVGTQAVVAQRASIGEGVWIGNGAFIDLHAVISDNCVIGANAVVGPNCNLAEACEIGQSASLRGGCLLSPGCNVGEEALLEHNVHLGAGATIAPFLEIAETAHIAPGTNQTQSVVTLIGANGTNWTEELPASGWSHSTAGAVQQDSGLPGDTGGVFATSLLFNDTPPSPGNPPPGYEDLADDIGTDIAPPSNRGTGHEYSEFYQCSWFAEQLRQKLADAGYSTTFTLVWELNPDWAWYKIRTYKWIEGHAMTDIHWPDGSVTWIEAQWINGEGIDTQISELDGNGDGSVSYFDGAHVNAASDGNKRVEVYNSRAEAEAAGAPCPGN